MDTSPAQVKVIFTTNEPDLQLPESKQQLLVPADIKRYGLSRILNSESMLDTSSPVPLDFLANGTFLRTSIDEYLAAEGLSHETTLTLQYVRSLIPPVYEASFEHDDWVGDLDVLSPSAPAAAGQNANERVATASYDGLVRVWNPSGNVIGVSPARGGGAYMSRLNAVKWLSPAQLASAGLDTKIHLWDYSESDDGFSGTLKSKMELLGHKKFISNLAVDGPSARILSASADGSVGYWSSSKTTAPKLPDENEPYSHSNKKAKLADRTNIAQRGPLGMMPVHDGPVTAAIFHRQDPTVAYSASQDATVRTLDLTTQREVSRMTTMHPILCAATLPNNLVAAGTSARHITLLDPRASSATTAAMTLRGHVNWVSSISPSPENDYSLVSGSWDTTCRVWDLRSVQTGSASEDGGRVSEPVYTIGREWLKGKKLPEAGEGAKVLSVVWDKAWGIVSGGEDKKVQVNRGRNLLSS